MKTIGLIGASGTLGKVAAKYLLAEFPDVEILALVRREDPELAALRRCRLLPGGIFDPESVESFCQASDVIVNLAARNPEGQPKDLQNLESFLDINAFGAASIASCAAKYQKPLLHFSTVAVYETGDYRAGEYLNESETLPAGDDKTIEYFEAAVAALLSFFQDPEVSADQRLARWRAHCAKHSYPQSAPVYGLSKLIGEESVLRLAKNVCCVRMCDVYGPGHESRGVIIDHLAALSQNPEVTVNFDFRETVSFIFIDDVTRFIKAACERMDLRKPIAKLVNLVGPDLDEATFANKLIHLSQRHSLDRTILDAIENEEQFDRRYSTAVLSELFPDFAITSISDGLDKTWAGSFTQ